MRKKHSGLNLETERALLGVALADAPGASVETRLALLNVEALHIGDLVARRVLSEACALPGLMRYAKALRLETPDVAPYLGALSIRDVVASVLRAAMGRPMKPAIAAALDALAYESESVATAIPGKKVDRLAQAAVTLGELMAGGVLDEYFAHAELMHAAERAGLSVHLATQTIAVGLETGKRARASRRSGPTGGQGE